MKVYVRVRPLSKTEEFGYEPESLGLPSSPRGSPRAYGIHGPPVAIINPGRLQLAASSGPQPQQEGGVTSSPKQGRKMSSWQFDWCFGGDATQASVYDQLGDQIARNVLEGFHGCVFAYGQTGSGKSHSIFGGNTEENRGLVPRIAEGILRNQANAASTEAGPPQFLAKLSYIEIYNEKVRDLLRPAPPAGSAAAGGEVQPTLEVRQHPKVGVFVTDLTEDVVQSTEDVTRLLNFGHKIRVVGRTNMNAASSRSHAIVVLHVERNLPGRSSRDRLRLRSKLYAVDLAGSERAVHVDGLKERQQERGRINTSLLALGLTISKLAAAQAQGIATWTQGNKSRPNAHIPYRNSKLTYLLSDALLGNCRTAMLACVSPLADHLQMTESTLRFAQCVKKIRTHPVRNEESYSDLVASLRAEIDSLKKQLSVRNRAGSAHGAREVLRERIQTVEKLEEQVCMPWNKQRAKSAAADHEREVALVRLGMLPEEVRRAWCTGGEYNGEQLEFQSDADPHLVNVCDDPLLSGCLTYALPKDTVVWVGSGANCKINIDGLGIEPVMCNLVCTDGVTVQISVCDDLGSTAGLGSNRRKPRSPRKSTPLYKKGVAQVYVNSEPLLGTAYLQHRDWLRIGCTHRFQLIVPRDTAQLRRRAAMHTMVNDLTGLCSSQQALAKEYASQLEERIGHKRATEVFKELQMLQPLIDEANHITEELRGSSSHELIFKSQVLTDVTKDNYRPDILVALRLFRIDDKSTGLLQTPRRSERPRSLAEEQHRSSKLVVIWSVKKFQQQLEAMRDLYQEVSERQTAWCKDKDPNPWEDDDDETGSQVRQLNSDESRKAPTSPPSSVRDFVSGFSNGTLLEEDPELKVGGTHHMPTAGEGGASSAGGSSSDVAATSGGTGGSGEGASSEARLLKSYSLPPTPTTSREQQEPDAEPGRTSSAASVNIAPVSTPSDFDVGAAIEASCGIPGGMVAAAAAAVARRRRQSTEGIQVPTSGGSSGVSAAEAYPAADSSLCSVVATVEHVPQRGSIGSRHSLGSRLSSERDLRSSDGGTSTCATTSGQSEAGASSTKGPPSELEALQGSLDELTEGLKNWKRQAVARTIGLTGASGSGAAPGRSPRQPGARTARGRTEKASGTRPSFDKPTPSSLSRLGMSAGHASVPVLRPDPMGAAAGAPAASCNVSGESPPRLRHSMGCMAANTAASAASSHQLGGHLRVGSQGSSSQAGNSAVGGSAAASIPSASGARIPATSPVLASFTMTGSPMMSRCGARYIPGTMQAGSRYSSPIHGAMVARAVSSDALPRYAGSPVASPTQSRSPSPYSGAPVRYSSTVGPAQSQMSTPRCVSPAASRAQSTTFSRACSVDTVVRVLSPRQMVTTQWSTAAGPPSSRSASVSRAVSVTGSSGPSTAPCLNQMYPASMLVEGPPPSPGMTMAVQVVHTPASLTPLCTPATVCRSSPQPSTPVLPQFLDGTSGGGALGSTAVAGANGVAGGSSLVSACRTVAPLEAAASPRGRLTLELAGDLGGSKSRGGSVCLETSAPVSPTNSLGQPGGPSLGSVMSNIGADAFRFNCFRPSDLESVAATDMSPYLRHRLSEDQASIADCSALSDNGSENCNERAE